MATLIDDQTFGSRLTHLLRVKFPELTPRDARGRLAQRIGVSEPAVRKWENNNALPEIPRLLLIVDQLDTSVEWLLRGIGVPHPAGACAAGERTAPVLREVDGEWRIDQDLRIHDSLLTQLTHAGMAMKPAPHMLAVQSPSDSMFPTIRKGEVVFIDCGIRQIEENEIALLGFDGALSIRRIQHRLGKSAIIADNRGHYPEFVLPSNALLMAHSDHENLVTKLLAGTALTELVPHDGATVFVFGRVVACLRVFNQ